MRNVHAFCPVLLGFLLLLIGCRSEKPVPSKVQALPSATTLPAPTVAASEHPVIVMYLDNRFVGMPDTAPTVLCVAVWGDGRIVWSADGSLLQARIDPAKLVELLNRLHEEGVFGNGNTYYCASGPDAPFDVIDMRLADRRLWLGSWHELFENNPKLVGTSHGIEILDGRNRDAVLAAQPPEYLRFRRIWSLIRGTVKSWVPSTGEPYTGTVPIPPPDP